MPIFENGHCNDIHIDLSIILLSLCGGRSLNITRHLFSCMRWTIKSRILSQVMDARPKVPIYEETYEELLRDCANFRRHRGYVEIPLTAEEEDFPLAFRYAKPLLCFFIIVIGNIVLIFTEGLHQWFFTALCSQLPSCSFWFIRR